MVITSLSLDLNDSLMVSVLSIDGNASVDADLQTVVSHFLVKYSFMT